jgi:hypothetical protein
MNCRLDRRGRFALGSFVTCLEARKCPTGLVSFHNSPLTMTAAVS